MSKKGDATSNNLNLTKKSKLKTEPNEIYNEVNKQNPSTKSVFENINDSYQENKYKGGEKTVNGSMMVSPTFHTGNVLSLKDQLFKQEQPKYLSIGFSLKQIDKNQPQKHNFMKNAQKEQMNKAPKNNDEKHRQLLKQNEQMRAKLIQHYQSKRYWKKIEKLFEQQDVDAVLAWRDSIQKYQTVKERVQKYQQQLSKIKQEMNSKDEKIMAFEKQIAQQKNDTRVISLKKCKGCENLEQKEKDYFQLYQQNKKISKQLEEAKDNNALLSELLKKSEQKYKLSQIVKEELEKKNIKLSEKEKEMANQLSTDRKSSSKLHIEIEQLKQYKYQSQKSLSKLQQKYKRQANDLKEELKQVQENTKIYKDEAEKLRTQLVQLKPKLLKMEIELKNIDSALKIKSNQCEELKKRHIQGITDEVKRKNDLQVLLLNKQQQLNKAYQLIDQSEHCKGKVQFELSQQRKINQEKEQQISRCMQIIKDLEGRCKQVQESQQRIKQNNQFFNLGKTKKQNNLSCINNPSTPFQNNIYSKKLSSKIKQIYLFIKQSSQQNIDSFQRRKLREEQSEDRQSVSLLQTQRYVNEISSQISGFINKYTYLHKQNDILREQIENQAKYKEHEMNQLRKEVQLKQEALKCVVCFVPDDFKNLALQFLYMTERLSNDQHHEQLQFEEYEDMKSTLENQSKEWKENYQRIDRRYKKMEEELHKLEEQNQDMRKKLKGKEVKKPYADFQSREIVSKKDIRKKYKFDN